MRCGQVGPAAPVPQRPRLWWCLTSWACLGWLTEMQPKLTQRTDVPNPEPLMSSPKLWVRCDFRQSAARRVTGQTRRPGPWLVGDEQGRTLEASSTA